MNPVKAATLHVSSPYLSCLAWGFGWASSIVVFCRSLSILGVYCVSPREWQGQVEVAGPISCGLWGLWPWGVETHPRGCPLGHPCIIDQDRGGYCHGCVLWATSSALPVPEYWAWATLSSLSFWFLPWWIVMFSDSVPFHTCLFNGPQSTHPHIYVCFAYASYVLVCLSCRVRKEPIHLHCILLLVPPHPWRWRINPLTTSCEICGFWWIVSYSAILLFPLLII